MMLDNRNKEELVINVQKNGNVPEKVAVSSACRGRINSFATLDLSDKNRATVKIPVASMETGVNEITLYDTAGRIWCDRLTFVNHNDKQLNIKKKQDKAHYSPLEKISMDFEITDYTGQPVETGFSLSVRDAGTAVSTTYDDNVMTNMLLSSDLKGYIENPRYYFEDNDAQRKADLDLLLLTQGWRRYVWRQMAGVDKFSLNQQAEKGILIDGVVKSFVRDKTKKDVDISILLRNDSLGILYESAKTDEQGYFSVYTRDIKGVWDVVLQTKEKNKKKDYRIMLDRLFSPVPLAYAGYEIKLASKNRLRERRIIENENKTDSIITLTDTTGLTMETRNHLLPTVTITEKRKTSDKADDLSVADIIYNVEKEMDAMADAGDYIGDNVVEFLLKTNENFLCYTEGGVRKYYYLTQPVVFSVNDEPLGKSPWTDIEDIPLSEVDTIAFVNSRQIAMRYTSKGLMDLAITGLEQLNTDSYSLDNGATKTKMQTINADDEDLAVYKTTRLGERIFILLYTYPNGRFRPEKKSIRQTTLQGYAYTREFYSPKYEYAVLPEDVDFRRTLYWNPDVKAGKDGKANVSFYNNSTSRQLLIDAETLAPSGLFGVYAE
jgi:hypothetical protein